MRIDKYLTSMGVSTRSEASRAARSGKILVDGIVVRDAGAHIDPEKNTVSYFGEEIAYRRHTYIMLNKPDGYISATDDLRQTTVLDLLDERLRKTGLFPCGRLDRDTLGLLILTDDGETAHRLLSPRHHAEKVYAFRCENTMSEADISCLESGVTLDDGYVTLPTKIKLNGGCEGRITLTEGKYHQIKRMFAAINNNIIYLERVEFAGILLDLSLKRGEWRFLNQNEIERLTKTH
jgi:16S rRNA pseudouridine516 synthase